MLVLHFLLPSTEKVIILLQISFCTLYVCHLSLQQMTKVVFQYGEMKNMPPFSVALRQIHVEASECNGCVLLQEWGQKAWGSGGQKPKTPNVYYYPVSGGLAFKRESPTVTLGPTVRLPPCCNFCPSPISHLWSGNVESRIKEHNGILCERRL